MPLCLSVAAGSPPFARGADEQSLPKLLGPRFTPVRTGSSWAYGLIRRTVGGSPPFARGAVATMFKIGDHITGSPPFARGAVWAVLADALQLRFTPVRTGSR